MASTEFFDILTTRWGTFMTMKALNVMALILSLLVLVSCDLFMPEDKIDHGSWEIQFSVDDDIVYEGQNIVIGWIGNQDCVFVEPDTLSLSINGELIPMRRQFAFIWTG